MFEWLNYTKMFIFKNQLHWKSSHPSLVSCHSYTNFAIMSYVCTCVFIFEDRSDPPGLGETSLAQIWGDVFFCSKQMMLFSCSSLQGFCWPGNSFHNFLLHFGKNLSCQASWGCRSSSQSYLGTQSLLCQASFHQILWQSLILQFFLCSHCKNSSYR